MLQLILREPAECGCGFRHATLDMFQVRLGVEISGIQVLPAVDGAMIGVLENPHLSSASGGVKLCHRSENFQENALHDVLGLPRITNDFESNAEDKAVVAVE